MKKTLISASVLLAMGLMPSMAAAQATVAPGNVDGTNATESFDDSIGAIEDKAVVDNGSFTVGALSPSKNSPKNSYGNTSQNSNNLELTNGFNDVNSDNVTAIGEDGIVAHANDLNQIVATNDFNAIVGVGVTGDATDSTAADGNLIMVDSSYTKGALSPSINSNSGTARTDLNELSAGSFDNFGGVATTGQNLGSATSVQQSVVVQSNGSI